MICRFCDQEILDGQEYIPISSRVVQHSNWLKQSVVTAAVVGAIHLMCLDEAFVGTPDEPDEPEEHDLQTYPELGYCSAPGCMSRVYDGPEGAQCSEGHLADPMFAPYREGDQD